MKSSSDAARPAGPVDRFLSAFTLVSRIPVSLRFAYDQSRIDFHLPLVGIAVSFLAALCFAVAVAAGAPASFAALFVLVIQYAAFNLFHLDGLMDSADALLAGGDKERRLAILKDSRIGVYAFFAGFADLAAKLLLFHRIALFWMELTPLQLAGFLAYPVAGRVAAALVPTLAKPARPDGLGAQAAASSPLRVAAGAAISTAAVAAAGSAAAGLIGGGAPVFEDFAFFLAVPAAALASAVLVSRKYRKAVDGYTGDALGAAVEAGEAIHLMLCLALLRLF